MSTTSSTVNAKRPACACGTYASHCASRARGHLRDRHAVGAHLPAERPERAENRAEQRRLAAAVGAEQRHDLAGLEPQLQAVSHRDVGVPNARSMHLEQAHQALRDRASNHRKNGAPATAVRMPSGISMAAAVRATVSAATRNLAPSRRAIGQSRRKSGPTSSRATCGTTRPTHPTCRRSRPPRR